MALTLRALALDSSLPSPNTRGYTGWFRYVTADAVATVIAAGYFDGARDKLAVNDQIDCICVVSGVADRVSLSVLTVPVAPTNITTLINTDASGA